MLEQDLWDLLNSQNVREIWNANVSITEHFGIEEKLTLKKKEVKIYYKLLEDFTDHIENNLSDIYEEIITDRDIEIDQEYGFE